MNTASLENYKKLYEISGWQTGRVIRDNPKQSSYNDSNIIGYEYDLGYLLRKLQDVEKTTLESFKERNGQIRWTCKLASGYYALADTPEDAACLLCIKLIEEGILKP